MPEGVVVLDQNCIYFCNKSFILGNYLSSQSKRANSKLFPVSVHICRFCYRVHIKSLKENAAAEAEILWHNATRYSIG